MRIFEKIKNVKFGIFAVPFVLFSSIIIRLSGAEHDTWPSFEEMKAGGNHGKK